ncbi:hypothetical protein EXN32_22455 [Agrobacterium tumefaciens]|uniref:hypothetical protein n=1 Tax=Agrobacterium TaxID=357 RepID=UPI00115C57E5|nr:MULTISPECIES: hypothetical protein [Agrobacterium]MDA5241023.1 hypothetical protein [Agrobacterium sp. MAFF310724]MDA5249745.1 hypothetical protein [Agrobacterium sp. MAFF210268]TRB12249.1 hypothetical protein EXN32_22455 [Agrobacterium tumefaciens]
MTKLYNLLSQYPNDFQLMDFRSGPLVIGSGNYIVIEVTQKFGQLEEAIRALPETSALLHCVLKEPVPVNENHELIFRKNGRITGDVFIIHPLDISDHQAISSDKSFKRAASTYDAILIEDKDDLNAVGSDGYFQHFVYNGKEYAVPDTTFNVMK